MLQKVDLTGHKYIWLSFFNVYVYPLLLFVSTLTAQVAAWFCASKHGLTNNVLITSPFYTYSDSLVK